MLICISSSCSSTACTTRKHLAALAALPPPYRGVRKPRRSLKIRPACAATDSESFYSVLGVDRDATTAEITSAYRTLLDSYRGSVLQQPRSETAQRSQAIQDAYETLSNDRKRQEYNMHGTKDNTQQHSKPDAHTGHTGTYQHATKGANVVTTIKLSFLEAALGAQREFTASVRLHCPDCSGSGLSSSVKPEDCASCKGVGQILRFEHCESGRRRHFGTCPACGGKGVQSRYWCTRCAGEGRALLPRNLRVKVPPGVDERSMLRLNGQGDIGRYGGGRGDLHLKFVIDKEQTFIRKGCDIYSTVLVSYLDAVLGIRLDIQTVHGPTAVQVPAGSQHGVTLKLRGQGVQGWGAAASSFGCHYLTLHVVVPTSCQPVERELLQRFGMLAQSAR